MVAESFNWAAVITSVAPSAVAFIALAYTWFKDKRMQEREDRLHERQSDFEREKMQIATTNEREIIERQLKRKKLDDLFQEIATLERLNFDVKWEINRKNLPYKLSDDDLKKYIHEYNLIVTSITSIVKLYFNKNMIDILNRFLNVGNEYHKSIFAFQQDIIEYSKKYVVDEKVYTYLLEKSNIKNRFDDLKKIYDIFIDVYCIKAADELSIIT